MNSSTPMSSISSSRAKRVSYAHLPAHERELIRRIRNAESAKRSRQKKKEEDSAIMQTFNENEQRIAELERRVVQLSAELNKPSSR